MKVGLSLITFVIVFNATAQPRCRVEGDLLTVPNGQVHLNFVPHRSVNEIEVYNLIAQHPKAVDAEVIEMLRDLVKRISPVLELDKQMADATRLQKLVHEGKVLWLGVEFSPDEVASTDEAGRDITHYFRAVQRHLSAAGMDQGTIEKCLLMYAGSPARYVWLKDRALRKTVRLVPLDANDLKARAIELDDERAIRRELVKQYPKVDVASTQDATRVLAKLDSLESEWAELTDREIEDFASTIKNAPLSQYTLALFKHQREFFRVQKARDRFAASVILAQPGTGWISEGSSHEHTPTRVVELCESQRNSPSLTTGSRGAR